MKMGSIINMDRNYDSILLRLAGDGRKDSRRRNAVLKALSSGEHLTVDELFDRAKRFDPKVGYTTVWRTVKLLESLGILLPHKFDSAQTRFELKESGRHHDHMICMSCGSVEEFTNTTIEDIQKNVAKEHKFEMASHKMEIYGYCKKCKAGKNSARR